MPTAEACPAGQARRREVDEGTKGFGGAVPRARYRDAVPHSVILVHWNGEEARERAAWLRAEGLTVDVVGSEVHDEKGSGAVDFSI